MFGKRNGRFANMTQIRETNFNITPANTDIWRGGFPFKTGDVFPRDIDRKRADEYKTSEELYKNRFNGIFDKALSWTDYMRDVMTNVQNFAIVADIPDCYTCTEAWVDLEAADAPYINITVSNDDAKFSDVSNRLSNLSSFISNTNFHKHYQDVVRLAYVMYGNKVTMISKLTNGSVKLVDMPTKCWIPFVNEDDTSTIEANVFFNIYTDERDRNSYCEFIVYLEDGKIEKYKFLYNSSLGGRLGKLVEKDSSEAFDGAGVSPIVVFTGDCAGNSIFGEGLYKYWDASIASCMRAYEAILILLERAKEIIRLIPLDAGETDEYTGVTTLKQKGAFGYRGETAPEVKMVLPIGVKECMDSAMAVYKECLNRVCRDTGLPVSYFDPTVLGSEVSAKSLKTSMFRSELKARRVSANFKYNMKQLIYKMGLACGIDVDMSEFDIIMNSGFVNDEESEAKIIQARVGNLATMNQADAIMAYDGCDMATAIKKANSLAGIKSDNTDLNIIETSSGDENEVSDGLGFTGASNTDDGDRINEMIETPYLGG